MYLRQCQIKLQRQNLNQMLHQLLCSLQGKSGSIIKRYEKEMAVDPSVNFLSAPQINMINEICKCGFYYHKITALMELEFGQAPSFSIVKSPSIYRKAMYQGLKKMLNEYIDLILAVQQQFLSHRHFTLANLRSQFQPYEMVLRQVSKIINYIYQQNYRGGTVINYLYKKYQTASVLLRKWLQSMINETIRVFINQVNQWILYGQIQDLHSEFFIHKVITEASEKFKLKSKSGGKNIQITDWEMFTLEQFMLPTCLVQLQIAGKILFIGKSIKILRSANKISSIPSAQLLEKVQKILNMNQYSQVVYEATIQQIRQIIAHKMIDFIMKEQNLVSQLKKINDYYLMFKGDFYHHFFEEAKGIQSIVQRQKAQKKINQVYLNNTFLRLGQYEDVKRLHFQLKTLGFSYSSFRNFTNLCAIGNIDLLQGKAIRFNTTGSALWNRGKQIVQNNFTMVYSFSFKKIKRNSTANKIIKSKEPTTLNLVIQNKKQVASSSHQNPSYLQRIDQYIAVRVGFQYSQAEQNYRSSLMIVSREAKKNEKEILLNIGNSKSINFLDEKSYEIKVHYSNGTLKAQILGQNGQKCQARVNQIRINNYLELQMGRSYLGFVANVNQSDFSIDLERWEMICKPSTFYNSHWSDLSLNFKIQWPINLILTQDILEAFNRIHKFLFPIRQIQIDLEAIWFEIPRLIKAQNRVTKQEYQELRKFERNLSALRHEINLVISSFWGYFHTDAAQLLWKILKKSLQRQNDFEDVIFSVNKYVKHLQIMYFFNKPNIQRKINQIVEKAKSFTIFFNNILTQNCIDQNVYNQCQRIGCQFTEKTQQFKKILKDYAKRQTSSYLYFISNRMESCLNQKDIKYM